VVNAAWIWLNLRGCFLNFRHVHKLSTARRRFPVQLSVWPIGYIIGNRPREGK
jgi:hypothetical protein